jgi:DeoR family glycerol-3-phosphate regulon repressor
MIDVLQTLASNPALTVLGTGGNVNLELNGFVGALTLSTLRPMLFDIAFIGALGVDLESGAVTTFDADDGLVKSLVIENASRSLLVVDAHKFETHGSYRFASLSDLDDVVTDSPTPSVRRSLAKQGVACL